MSAIPKTSRFHDKPVVVGIFGSIADAKHAVRELLHAGFAKRQITVVCSDQEKESHFREFERQEPAGYYLPRAAAGGAIAGVMLGSLAAALLFLILGQIEAMVAGILLVLFGGIAGGFIGAMLTRNAEKELANFYDQGVEPGKILVAAEDHGETADKSLLLAERILVQEGVKPLDLPEG